VGFVMRGAKAAAIHLPRDKWIKQAAAACIAAAKDMISAEGPIRSSMPIGKLADDEWQWIGSVIVWSWIAARAEQAASEGWNEERTIRATGLDPDPWFSGAIAAILPWIPEALPEFDWSAPVGAWSRDDVVAFLSTAIVLARRAVAARNVAEEQLAGRLEAVDTLLDELTPF
jgi:hypothetical protein